MRLAFAFVALLAACAPATSPTARGFRDPSVTLASVADLDPARLAGRWHEVARFPDGGCAGGTVEYATTAPGALDIVEACGGRAARGRAERSGPGRFRVSRGSGGSGATEEWVLWLDANARTAVIVRPDGMSGRILDRTPEGSEDRMRAARTVLDFNGFDPRALVMARPAG